MNRGWSMNDRYGMKHPRSNQTDGIMRFLALGILSGVLAGIAFLSSHCSFLVWGACIPFLFVIDRTARKPLFFCSAVAGMSFFLTTVFWIGYVSRLGMVVLVLYLSCYWVLFAYLARPFFRYPLEFLTIPAVWVVCEFLREHIWTGFGWAILGYSQHGYRFLIQIADLIGTKGLSFLIISVNCVFYSWLVGKRKLARSVILLTIIAVLVAGYSFWTGRQYTSSGSIPVGVMQPNIPQRLKWDPRARTFIINRLQNLSHAMNPDGLLIYPEAAWPDPVDDITREEFLAFLENMDKDVLMGVVLREGDSFFNAAMLYDRGKIDIYRKIKLVPFGEYVPWRGIVNSIDVLNALGDISPGDEYHTFTYRDRRFAVLICFEDVFPSFTSRLARDSDFLINITNDAWFNGQPQARQHLGIMTMRAVENRISIVRSANTGISGYVDFSGMKHLFRQEEKNVFFSGARAYRVNLNEKRSIYSRYGDVPLLIVCLVVLVLGVRIGREDADEF